MLCRLLWLLLYHFSHTKTQDITSDAHPAQESPELQVTVLVHMLPGTGSSLLFKSACFILGGL